MDSDNILSILSFLGQAPPSAALSGQMPEAVPVTYQPVDIPEAPISNVLQSVADPGISAQIAELPPAGSSPGFAGGHFGGEGQGPLQRWDPPKTQAQPAEPERPRKRRSVLETIGRIADVLAKVGGAEALYEPTLNARDDRAREIDMEALRKQLLSHQVRAGGLDVEAAERKRLGTALGALAGRENVAELWPSIAEQAGIDPIRTAAIGQILQTNPDAAGIFARSLGADIDNLGKNVYFGTDGQGKTVAYQVGEDGRPHILDFSEVGVTPSDPTKVVNTGGASVVLDSRGNVRRVLPNTERPGGAADRASRERIAAMRGTGGAGSGDNAAMVESAQGSLNELRAIYGDLNKMGAMVSPAQAADKNVVARIRASGIGQVLEGAVGTEAQTKRDRIASIRPGLMQALAKATGMTGRQLDSNADVKLFMQTVTNPAASYEANMAAIDGLERFLKANIKKAPAPAKPAAPAKSDGWSIVKVQ